MKKLLLIGVAILGMAMTPIAEAEDDCSNNIDVEVNSNSLLSYIDDYQLNVFEICAKDYCERIIDVDLKKSVDKFQEHYYDMLKHKVDDDTYIELYFKGFKITSLGINSCN